MSLTRTHLKLVALGASCAAIGAGASAIATAGAASTGSGAGAATAASTGSGSGAATAASTRSGAATAAHRRARAALLSRAVHATVVVPTKTGFATATLDRGFVQSVSGRQLTIREGTKQRTYRTVSLTIPSGARIRDDGRPATLGQLTAGQRVRVLEGPRQTAVIARTPR